MPEQLDDKSTFSRFLFYNSEINRTVTPHKITTKAITGDYPNGYSVFETSNQCNVTINSVCQEHVISQAREPKPLLAWFNLPPKAYIAANLAIEFKEPPPRHYNIHGMPVGVGLEAAKKTALRQKMVAEAQLTLVP